MAAAWKYIRKKILDFGSGEGITADHFALNNNVIAIEPSKEQYHSLKEIKK